MGRPVVSNPDLDVDGDDFEGVSSSSETGAKSPVKRKRDGQDDRPESKRAAKRKRTKRPADVEDDALDMSANVNHAIAHMDSQLVADHIAQRTKRFQSEASLVELEDIYIPGKAILDTTAWEGSRTSDQLPAFIERFSGLRRTKKGGKLADAAKEKGSPHTLVVAASGQRAADLSRDLRGLQTKQAKVMKLFAKHIKLKDAIKGVKETRTNVGVGTPQRIIDLLEDGALSMQHLERIVIDASHIDMKKRGILDMKETQIPLVKLLTLSKLKDRYGVDDKDVQIELLFF
ncbi:hypothetical protein K431DRAFT_281617 [Polychaeton citri CBS 116435]|uniref:U3-containing 90S pre-ribosomal complex subunit-domain containing protein n=1 Tax=Polychaeton citri CBS 116435 TaxID=1314669 RepID=A0A9P4UTF1_9PEZI|nr:hypothetical protein K431DRAFT_281617 [Polychaeton citri CBS 116435]